MGSPTHPPTSSAGAGLAAVVVAVTGFSWGFILVKLISLPAPLLAFWRLIIGATALWIAALVLRAPLPTVRGSLIIAGVAFAVHQLLFITATNWTSVAIVTLIAATQPLLVALLSRRVVGEPVAPALFGCAALAVLGVAVVVNANLRDASRTLSGDLLAICNLFAFTAYFLAAKRARIDGAPTLTFTAAALSIALLVVCPALLLCDLQWPDSRQWGFIAILSLVAGNGHLLVNWAHTRISAALSAIVLAALPLLSSIWAYLVLDEPYTPQHFLGILIVMVGIETARRVEAHRNPADA